MEHHSNIVPWQLNAQEREAIIKEIPITDSGESDLDTYEKLLNPRVKVVSTCLISNTLAPSNPVDIMIKKAHKVGAKFLVDAAQAVAHIPVIVAQLNPTSWPSLATRCTAQWELGFSTVKKTLNAMPPYQGGGGMNRYRLV